MTHSYSFKVFMASAVGAFIGSLIALQLTSNLWWVGMVVGGVIGYLGYDAKSVVRMIPTASHAARRSWHTIGGLNYRVAVRLGGQVLRKALRVLGVSIAIGVACGIGSALVGALWFFEGLTPVALIGHETPANFFFGTPEDVFASRLCIAVCGMIVFLLQSAWTLETYGLRGIREHKKDITLSLLYKVTPLGFVTWYLPQALWFFAQCLFWIVVSSGAFFWILFKLIHSDLRLLCGIDAAIGAAIGYLSHNALIGALAGGALGVVNFELVSKRWLKLVRA